MSGTWGLFPFADSTDKKFVQGVYNNETDMPIPGKFSIGYTPPPFTSMKEIFVMDKIMFWVFWLWGSCVPVIGPLTIMGFEEFHKVYAEWKLAWDFGLAIFTPSDSVYFEERSLINWLLYPLRQVIVTELIMPWIILWSWVPGLNLLMNWLLLMLLFWNIAY